MNEKIVYVARSLSRGTHKKYETFIINEIYSRLNNPNLEIATQQHVVTKDGTKYIDLYFPQLKIAIEVDEPYHDEPNQKVLDKKREEKIQQAILESTVVDLNKEIHIERIVLSEFSDISALFKRIDEVVSYINSSIKESLVWNFTEDEKTAEIKTRGYLQRGDSFRIMPDIMRTFGVKWNGNGCGKCTYWLSDQYLIWSPTLSVEGSNKDGWVNTISKDLTEIYETGTKKEKTRSGFERDRDNQIKRIVFLKYKDALGYQRRRFLGVYIAESFDDERKTEIWKLLDEKVSIDIKK